MRKRGNILVVDDDPLVFDVVSVYLEDDYELAYVDNGQQALVTVHSEPPDLILLDIGMPDIDGYELCWRLKMEPETKGIPVVFVTAFSSAEDEAAGLAAGAVDYIAKPINPAVLKARVKTHMDLKLQRDFLQGLVRQDALTDLPNRRGFEETLDREWRRAARSGNSLSMVVMAIDDFDRYQDEYGQIGGDGCLKSVAAACKTVLHRAGDFLVRYDEGVFVALLADTPYRAIQQIADRLRAAVEAAAIPHNSARHHRLVTLSVGAASIVPDHRHDASELLETGEALMREISHSGGNAVAAKDLGGDQRSAGLARASISPAGSIC